MKPSTTLSTLALLFTIANAQRSFIGSPAAGTTVQRGQNIVVQVVRPNSLQGSQEVGLAIGLQSCPDPANPCTPPSQSVGNVLYRGPFDPQLYERPGEPYQNFTVTVPTADFFQGTAQLSVNRFHLIGAGPAATLEFNTLLLNVVAPSA